MLLARPARVGAAACARIARASTTSGTWIEGPLGVDTKLVHAGVDPDPLTGAVLTPVYQSTTYVQA